MEKKLKEYELKDLIKEIYNRSHVINFLDKENSKSYNKLEKFQNIIEILGENNFDSVSGHDYRKENLEVIQAVVSYLGETI